MNRSRRRSDCHNGAGNGSCGGRQKDGGSLTGSMALEYIVQTISKHYKFMMYIRKLIRDRKIQKTDTNWLITDLQPKHAPIYKKTKPIRAGWQWRSAQAEGSIANFVLLAECNPKRGNWKAVLIIENDNGASVVSRFEDHASHCGLHIHADCDRGGREIGAQGLDSLMRIPPAGSHNRRFQAWTENAFWEAAKRFFRIQEVKGPLI